VPRTGQRRAKNFLAIATTACNVWVRTPIPAEVLADILRGRRPLGPWGTHLRVFFSEVPVEVVAGVARQAGCARSDLRRVYERCGASSRDVEEYLGAADAAG
jgi:hypothetical protein